MSNKTYDILKWVAQYLLPALATLYFAVAKIWGLPYGEEIVGTLRLSILSLGFCWASVRRTTTSRTARIIASKCRRFVLYSYIFEII